MRINYICLLLFAFLAIGTLKAQNSFRPFVEYGAAVHTGDNTPLWLNSNQQGLSSLKNNTYIRGGIYANQAVKNWTFEEAVDLAGAAGFTSTFVVQQAYVDVRYKWLGLLAGSKEMVAPLLNSKLSSGSMTWSGNARPIPQVRIGIPEYLQLCPRFGLKGSIAYGWFTDSDYQKEHVRLDRGYFYTRNIKYHHKEGFLRIGFPEGKWLLEIGMTMETQFGGYMVTQNGETDLGNGLKDYFRAFVPGAGDEESPSNDALYYQGNYLGSEYIKGTYNGKHFAISAYLNNHFDDFSAMGKQNGWDGLWGIEMKLKDFKPINNIVLEYLQTTNQSGPLHGLHEPEEGPVHKTGGSDNYYNNGLYPGWSHWGMAIGNPLITSPIYNKDGCLAFKYNRVKAVHIGWGGEITPEWNYTAKLTHNRTWGTYSSPTLSILENFSAYVAFDYKPRKLDGWSFFAAMGLDTGELYGDNWGIQLRIHKSF